MIKGLAALLLAILPGALAAETAPAEPPGYRMQDYRAPVPATLTGARVVGIAEARDLWDQGDVAFIDVLPQPPKPPDLPEGTIWRDKPRDSIPGAIWLPNTGYGAIAESTAAYFRRGLDKATGGDPAQPILFFCLTDCWMSWNAARRAVEWGYSAVYWLPQGTDGWAAAGHPLERVLPEEPQPGTE